MKTLFCILFALLFVACGGSDNGNDKLGDEPLGVSVTEALKADCPNGGVVINQGIDANGNGKIDTAEITSSEKVCNGVNGTSNKIVKSIFCTGDLSSSLTAMYEVEIFASGDLFATAGVYGVAFQIGASTMYSAGQVGAGTAAVLFTYDYAGTLNGGYWKMSLDRTTLVSTVEYNDVDVTSGKLIWTKPASECVVNNY
jgi:hypothetical protein